MHDKPCPHCGYCPTCGRASVAPYWPWGCYPYTPIYPGTAPQYPWRYPITYTSTISGNTTTSGHELIGSIAS
jgi:hypothetical protein